MLITFLSIWLLLTLGVTVISGFPGLWSLTALVPAFILTTTIQHYKLTHQAKGAPPDPSAPSTRPVVIVMGGLFTFLTAFVAIIFMWAAVQAPKLSLSSQRFIDSPPEELWDKIKDPRDQHLWSIWNLDAEPTGRGSQPEIGRMYRTTFALEEHRLHASAELFLYDPEKRTLAWRISPNAESPIRNLVEKVSIQAEDKNGSLVLYELSYETPSVMSRVASRIGMQGALGRVLDESLERLADLP